MNGTFGNKYEKTVLSSTHAAVYKNSLPEVGIFHVFIFLSKKKKKEKEKSIPSCLDIWAMPNQEYQV
jgi:hypothetical protein